MYYNGNKLLPIDLVIKMCRKRVKKDGLLSFYYYYNFIQFTLQINLHIDIT